MSIVQHFFAEGKYLGQASRVMEHSHNEAHVPYGYAFFCPVCADLWARCPVMYGSRESKYMVQTISCRKCAAHHDLGVPGSLFLTWDKTFNDLLPDDAIRRELAVHLDFAEKKGFTL